MLKYEQAAWDNGFASVAGADEVGRGPLAGPVVVSAILFDRNFLLEEESGLLAGLTDSKKLTPAKRDAFFAILTGTPKIRYAVGHADPREIDEVNILRATHRAFARAVSTLTPPADHVLVDGHHVPGLPCSSTSIIKGDAKSLSIAAASVVAKVTRDRSMIEWDQQYPGYGFRRHKGYGTQEHLEAIRRMGPSPIHRMSFKPLSNTNQRNLSV